MDISEISYLVFYLNNELFAINVAEVTEVLEIRDITKIPQTPDSMRGVINLRGDVIPVISLRLMLGMEEIADNGEMVIIILSLNINNKTVKIGAVADKVKEVLDILPGDILPMPDISSNYNTEFIHGIHKQNNEFIMILNIDNLILNLLSAYEQKEKLK